MLAKFQNEVGCMPTGARQTNFLLKVGLLNLTAFKFHSFLIPVFYGIFRAMPYLLQYLK